MLIELCEAWLNPPGANVAGLKQRTRANLYNAHPAWLITTHDRRARAVARAYGWLADLSDEELLGRLRELNRERAGASAGDAVRARGDAD